MTTSLSPSPPLSPPQSLDRQHRAVMMRRTAAHFDRYAPGRAAWRERSRLYYDTVERLCRHEIPPGARVLEVGCGIGDLLAAVRPSFGVGVDVSRGMVAEAGRRHAGNKALRFFCADAHDLALPDDAPPFDYVICSDLLGHLADIQLALGAIRRVCSPTAKVVITYWNFAWQIPMLVAERLGAKMPQGAQNWLGMADVDNLLRLTHFDVLSEGTELLLPKHVPVLAPLLNRGAIRLPFLRTMGLCTYWVARPAPAPPAAALSASVIIPCRNEEGNIPACIDRLPPLGTHTEVIFVDGASTDGTRDRILEQIERHPQRDIKLIDQVPRKDSGDPAGAEIEHEPGKQVRMLRLGKGDAVRKGFAAAKGDVLFILDSDLTVPPEDLPKFLEPIATGTADFVNGTRLVYPQEDEAMMPIRYLGNKFFSVVFTWLLGQPIKDTLCGTKVLRRRDYERLAANRSYFGDFDPFGDFDLLFGAARLGLRIAEVPVRYRARTYGYSKVKVLEHGPLLLKMSLIGFRRLKLAPWLARLRGTPLPVPR